MAPRPQTSQPEGTKAPRSLKVLVVEDDLDTVHTLTRLLRSDGHQVDFAINGYVAVAIAKKFQPDVVVLDLGLPGLDGFEVCSRIKAEMEHVRVIAVTAYASDDHRVRSRAAGCEMHIVKPYDPRFLLEVINSPPARSPI
ncbi:MAG TPA: response regulator [Burkholderiales bacterium]|jgi:DNA-binding response OmpR family regulator